MLPRLRLQQIRDAAEKASIEAAERGDRDSADAWETIGLVLADANGKIAIPYRIIEARLPRDIDLSLDPHAPIIDLFAVRRSSDDKSILDDLDLASQLLERHCGECGFSLANSIWKFIGKVREVIRDKGVRP